MEVKSNFQSRRVPSTSEDSQKERGMVYVYVRPSVRVRVRGGWFV